MVARPTTIAATSPELFYYIGAAFAIMCLVITWQRYARPGAPKPS